MSFINSAARLQEKFLQESSSRAARPYRVFISASDMHSRAIVRHASAIDPSQAWTQAIAELQQALGAIKPTILRADWVVNAESMTWQDFTKLLGKTRRNYFRRGIALPDFSIAFTEQELNANSMLYRDGKDGSTKSVFNAENSDRYCQSRFGCDFPRLKPEDQIVVFDTAGVFIAEGFGTSFGLAARFGADPEIGKERRRSSLAAGRAERQIRLRLASVFR